MSFVHNQLDVAEQTFRDILKLYDPLRANWPIDKRMDPQGRHWFFATDGKRIIAQVNEPDKIEKAFKKAIIPVWSHHGDQKLLECYGQNAPGKLSSQDLETMAEHLCRDNFVYLLFHEVTHDKQIPQGKNDEKRIDLALYEGIKKAVGGKSSKIDIIKKVGAVRNMAYDLDDDCVVFAATQHIPNSDLERRLEHVYRQSGFHLNGTRLGRMPDGVVPMWDVVEFSLAGSGQSEGTYGLSRMVYAALFVNDQELRDDLYKIFKTYTKKAAQKGFFFDVDDRFNKVLQYVVKEADDASLSKHGISRQDYLQAVDIIISQTTDNRAYLQARNSILSTIITMANKDDLRYDLFEGFIQPFADLISTQEEEGRPSQGGMGGNSSQALSNILDALGEAGQEGEADDIMAEMANDAQQQLQALGSQAYQSAGNQAGKPSGAQIDLSLGVQAADEYYRKHAQPIKFQSTDSKLLSIAVANQKTLRLKDQYILTPNELSQLHIPTILLMEQAYGIPMLYFDSKTNLTQYFEYEEIEEQLKGIDRVQEAPEIPEFWFQIEDTSGSMEEGPNGSTTNYIGSDNRLDIVQMIDYGLMKKIHPLAKKHNMKVQVGCAQFSERTIYSGVFDLDTVFEDPDNRYKRVKLIPQWAGTNLHLDVFGLMEKDAKQSRTLYSIITDGQMNTHGGSLPGVAASILQKPNRSMVFINIGPASNTYHEMKQLSRQYKNLLAASVKNVKDIEPVLDNAVVRYKK